MDGQGWGGGRLLSRLEEAVIIDDLGIVLAKHLQNNIVYSHFLPVLFCS